MADRRGNPKKKPYLKAIFWGIISLIGYVIIFTRQDIITEYSTRGHWYAALPIAAVFFFSFVHGGFCSYLLSVMGIEAVKKKK